MSIGITSKPVSKVDFAGRYFTYRHYLDLKNVFSIRRQRKYNPTSSPFEVDFNSLEKVKTGHVRLSLSNIEESGVKFQLDLFALEHNSLRVKINEINSIRKRFEVEHSLVGEPKLVK